MNRRASTALGDGLKLEHELVKCGNTLLTQISGKK
jgi:hypothetical protein